MFQTEEFVFKQLILYEKLFINDDFISSQYLWLIPIIDGYCKRNKIENIILLKKFPQKHIKSRKYKKIYK